MRSWAWLILGGTVLASVGAAMEEAGNWLRLLTTPASPWMSGLVGIRAHIMVPSLLVVAGAALLLIGYARSSGSSRGYARCLEAAGALIVAVAGTILLPGVARPFFAVPPGYIAAFSSALGLAAGVITAFATPAPLRSPRRAVRNAVVVGLGWLTLCSILRLVTFAGSVSAAGFGVFASVAAPPELRAFPNLWADSLTGAVAGAMFGTGLALMRRRGRVLAHTLTGAASCLWISAVFYVGHMLAASLVMQSGLAESTAVVASLVIVPVAAVVAAAGLLVPLGGFTCRICRFATVGVLSLVILGAGLYIGFAHAGSGLFRDAFTQQLYRTRVYIHFKTDGSWTRTVERNADDLRISACDDLLRLYPNSIYAADARYIKARSQYASWQFDHAEDTLSDIARRYPLSHGASTTLLAYCALAQGDYAAVAGDFGRTEWVYARWRSSEGAQMVGHAYEVTGKINSARGLYSYYIRTLLGGSDGTWVESAIAHAETMIGLLESRPLGHTPAGVVRGAVTGPAGPVQGVHVALVQPHIDAASPAESIQFSGALTIPLWFGIGATTRRDGRFELKGVPYGEYQVVIGFDPVDIPRGTVIAGAVRPVMVDRAELTIPNIRFVKGVRPISPVDGAPETVNPELRWAAVPGAAHYSVSVIAQPPGAEGAANSRERGAGTCWVQTNITETTARVDSRHFVGSGGSAESRQRTLLRGRRYMWVVMAYDEEGNIISSSEHYRLEREPVFTVEANVLKGG